MPCAQTSGTCRVSAGRNIILALQYSASSPNARPESSQSTGHFTTFNGPSAGTDATLVLVRHCDGPLSLKTEEGG